MMERKAGAARGRVRMVKDRLATGLAVASTMIVLAPLVAVFIYLLYKGANPLRPRLPRCRRI